MPYIKWNHAIDSYKGSSSDSGSDGDDEQPQQRAERKKGPVVAGARAGRSNASPLPRHAERVTASADDVATAGGLGKGVNVLLGHRKLHAQLNAYKAKCIELEQQGKRRQAAAEQIIKHKNETINQLANKERSSGQAAYDKGYADGRKDEGNRQRFESSRPSPNLVPVSSSPAPPASAAPATSASVELIASIAASVAAATQQQQQRPWSPQRFDPFQGSPYRYPRGPFAGRPRSRSGKGEKDRKDKKQKTAEPEDKAT